jgi:hypothetical protein
MRRGSRRGGSALVAGGAAVAAAVPLLRAWQRRWDATVEEAARPMPLDDRVAEPTAVTNRAITILAGPERIWPWLVQMGELPRGGFYSYVTVERLLGMKVENAEEILPEFQEPKVGDALDRRGTMVVQFVEPGRCLVLGPPPTPAIQTTWALGLHPAGAGATRLVSRCRVRLPRTAAGLLWAVVLDPGQFVMERKMLLEIRRRAEARDSRGPG